jgi:peptidoglycan hydrolase CwlO-like protein
MDDDKHIQLLRLQRQCKWSAVTSVLFVLIGLAIAMPPALRRRAALKAANNELLGLQAEIVEVQSQIRDVQAKILSAQKQIGATINGHQR